MSTNGKRGGLASTSPQAETAGGESCSFSGFNDYHGHEDEDEEDEKESRLATNKSVGVRRIYETSIRTSATFLQLPTIR